MRHLYLTNKTKEALGRKGKGSMRRVAVEQQSWIPKGIGFLPTLIFMALVAGFPWQTQVDSHGRPRRKRPVRGQSSVYQMVFSPSLSRSVAIPLVACPTRL